MTHHHETDSGPGDSAGPRTEAGARLGAIVERQRELLGQLDALSRRQTALVEIDDTDALLDLLGQRQLVVDQIARGQARLEAEGWEATLATLPEGARADLRRRLDALGAIAGEIARRDDADRVLLESRKSEIAAELTVVHRGRDAIARYMTRGATSAPTFQDREA